MLEIMHRMEKLEFRGQPVLYIWSVQILSGFSAVYFFLNFYNLSIIYGFLDNSLELSVQRDFADFLMIFQIHGGKGLVVIFLIKPAFNLHWSRIWSYHGIEIIHQPTYCYRFGCFITMVNVNYWKCFWNITKNTN